MTAPDADASGIRLVAQLSERHVQQLHGLYKNEWWASERTLEDARECVSGSQLCIALVDGNDDLVAFARVLTDFIFKALIFDVIVAPDLRKSGLGDRLMQAIIGHEQLTGVRHLELYCLPDMIPFYQRHDFSEDVGEVGLMRRLHG